MTAAIGGDVGWEVVGADCCAVGGGPVVEPVGEAGDEAGADGASVARLDGVVDDRSVGVAAGELVDGAAVVDVRVAATLATATPAATTTTAPTIQIAVDLRLMRPYSLRASR